MADPQMKGFARRLKRIDKIHRSGGGFEATGTLGQSYYTRARRRQGRGLLRPALTIVLLFIAFKAMLVAHQGMGTYVQRLAELEAGTLAQKISALVLAVDPLTQVLAKYFAVVVA